MSNSMKYNLDELYKIAKDHKDSHKSCGGEPYKTYNELFQIVKDYTNTVTLDVTVKILEVGTAVGFTTYVLYSAISIHRAVEVEIDSIEFHQEHADEAEKNISDWGGDVSKINFFVGDAKNILPKLILSSYDIIFFDGYGAKLIFYKDFEELLKIGGILITANQFLKSTEPEYFKELEASPKWEFVTEFEDTKIYKKIN